MEQDGDGVLLGRDAASGPVDGVGRLDRGSGGARDGDRGVEALQAITLIGPNIGAQALAGGGVGQVDRLAIARRPLEHLDPSIERRR